MKEFNITNWATLDKVGFKEYQTMNSLLLLLGFVDGKKWLDGAVEFPSSRFYLAVIELSDNNYVVTNFYYPITCRSIRTYDDLVNIVTNKILNDEPVF